MPRLGGTVHTHRDNLKGEPLEATKKFVRAIAKAIDYIRMEGAGIVELIRKHFRITDEQVAGNLYNQGQGQVWPPDPAGPLPSALRVGGHARPWLAQGKPLPDIEQLVARDLLNEVLREMGKPMN